VALVVRDSLSPARDLGPDAGAKSIRARFPACWFACCSSYLRFWVSAISMNVPTHSGESFFILLTVICREPRPSFEQSIGASRFVGCRVRFKNIRCADGENEW